MIATAADRIVGLVRYGYRRRAWLSALGLVMTLVVATGYLLFGALRVNPFASSYRLTVELPESAGLLPNQDVTLRGVPVGKVERLDITPGGVNAIVNVRSTVRIPESSDVRVSGLSPAGEQYIDFVDNAESAGDSTTFLADGAVITQGRATVPVSLADLLANADGALGQVDPAKLELIKRELSMSDAGPQKLADIVDGGTFLLTTLDSVLPETSSLLRTSRVALTLVGDKNAGIAVASDNLTETFEGVDKMREGYRRLTDQTPGTLAAVDNLFVDNSDTMVQLLGNLSTTSRLLYLRVPALNALFPSYRTSVLDALGSAMHTGGFWATAEPYPRYTCDYGTPKLPPASADYPEPFMYTYCRDVHPGVLVRGAKNAPRPAGDDTAGPPPGADLGRQTDPTPKGRYTIPTPYGGPTLPIEPPR
ncbi:MlaD family protein [Mycobacterium sp. AMU20-3851]|uniref:MlaD family protein n=1 Tax=Mycobacterium sp. AMU20-3851 TaxID=3122055 RepID=UPI0037543EDD